MTVLLHPVQSALGCTRREPLPIVDHPNGEWMVRELGWTNGALPQRGLVDLEVAIPLNRSACSMNIVCTLKSLHLHGGRVARYVTQDPRLVSTPSFIDHNYVMLGRSC